ncbi:virion structural protein [Pseudomonas phage PA1C]|nr:virion structural protein [Pseudomonas phage PA1C]
MLRSIHKYVGSLEEFKEEPITPEVAAVAEAPLETQEVEVIEAPTNVVDEAPVELPVPTPVPEIGAVGTDTVVETEPVEVPAEFAPIEGPVDVTEAVGEIDAVSHAHVEKEILEQRADELIETQHALEAYSGLLRQARGEISQQTAAFLRVGIKQAERVLGTNQVSTGLENYNAGERSDILRAEISVENIKEYANKAFEKLKEIIEKIIDAIIGGIDNLMNGISKADKVVTQLEEILASGGNLWTGTGKTFVLNNPAPVFANGKSKLGDTKVLSGLAHFSAYVYPAAVKKYYENLAKLISGYNVVKGDGEEMSEKLYKATAPLDDIYGANYDIFPGNMRVELQADGIVYGIGPATSAKEAPAEFEVKVSSPSTLRTNTKRLRDIIEILKAARDEHVKIKEGAEALKKAVSKIEDQLNNEDLDDASKAAARKVTQTALELIRESNPRSREIIRYVTRTVVAYASVYIQEAKLHKEPAKD